MTTIITRLFSKQATAAAAAKALQAKGLRQEGAVEIVAAMADHGAAAAAIQTAGVPSKAAQAYAGQLLGDAALVIARAPFGTALDVAAALDGHGPVASGLAREEFYIGSVDRRPLAPNRHLPVLLDSDSFVLSGRVFPALTRSSTPFSSLFGMPTVSRSSKPRDNLVKGGTTPFSAALGLPLLSGGRGK